MWAAKTWTRPSHVQLGGTNGFIVVTHRKIFVMVSINCQFDRTASPGRQAIRLLYLQGIILIVLMDVGRPILPVGRLFRAGDPTLHKVKRVH